METLDRLWRKWARKFFSYKIRQYAVCRIISLEELMYLQDSDGRKRKHYEFELVRSMAEKMYAENLIDIEIENRVQGGVEIRARIHVI